MVCVVVVDEPSALTLTFVVVVVVTTLIPAPVAVAPSDGLLAEALSAFDPAELTPIRGAVELEGPATEG